MGSKKLSGYQNRVRKAEEDKKAVVTLSKCRKIDQMFSVRSDPDSRIKSDNNNKVCTAGSEIDSDNHQQLELQQVKPNDENNAQCALRADYTQSVNAVQQSPPVDNLIAEEKEIRRMSTTSQEPVDDTIVVSMHTVHTDTDPAKWTINEEIREHVATHGFHQNNNIDFVASQRVYRDKTRYLSKTIFSRVMKNGEIQNRWWLVYSNSTGCVFCVACLLYMSVENESSFIRGFNDWKNARDRLESHENSVSHKDCVAKFKLRTSASGRVDEAICKQFESEVNYWREVLRRVCEVIRSLAMRGLAFRGDNEHFDSDTKGNFLATLELIAKFDPFLAAHIEKFSEKGSGNTSYLSKTVYEELISVMGAEVQRIIAKEIKEAKYFGISVDSTPDISHIDQLTFIIRYVASSGEPVERFVGFMANIGHKSEQLCDAVQEKLEELGLNIKDMRGQSYDNASNMSGKYSGLQARIAALNRLAVYVPCSPHSLNLVGSHASESCQESSRFFLTLQELYNFFTASTHRWEILTSNITRVLQNLSVTRWSARSDACQALRKGWPGIVVALQSIQADQSQKAATRSEAKDILTNLLQLELYFGTQF